MYKPTCLLALGTYVVFSFQAEKIASRMICEDRMRGSIDQVDPTSFSATRSSLHFYISLSFVCYCTTSLMPIEAQKLWMHRFSWPFLIRDPSCQVEGVIHFEDDSEELQQWDQQVNFCLCCPAFPRWSGHFHAVWQIHSNNRHAWQLSLYLIVRSDILCCFWQIVGLCQALNDVLDSMAKKGLPIPVWRMLVTRISSLLF